MRRCRVGIELQGAFQLRICTRQVPVENPFRFAQVAMRLRIFFIECNCLQGCFPGCRVSFKWSYVDVGQKIPNLGDPSPSSRKCWIFFESALKETKCAPQILFAAFIREIETLQIEIICLRVPLFM